MWIFRTSYQYIHKHLENLAEPLIRKIKQFFNTLGVHSRIYKTTLSYSNFFAKDQTINEEREDKTDIWIDPETYKTIKSICAKENISENQCIEISIALLKNLTGDADVISTLPSNLAEIARRILIRLSNHER